MLETSKTDEKSENPKDEEEEEEGELLFETDDEIGTANGDE